MRTVVRRVAGGLAALLVLAIVGLGLAWLWARPADPGPFLASAVVGDTTPGTLLAIEDYALDLPAGSRARRFLYTTTREDGSLAVASAVLMVPAATAGPLPMIGWAHGTTGMVSGCAPSVAAPFANVPAVPELLAAGWAYVATDYVGLGTGGGHAYLVGREAGYAVLDALKAARQVSDIQLAPRAVLWGHSQGGNSALWAGMLAKDYAPGLEIAGVAAMAPASDLPGLIAGAEASTFGKIVSSYVLEAYGRTYADISPSSYAGGVAGLAVSDIAGRCVLGYEALLSVAMTKLLPRDGLFSGDRAADPLMARLRQNVPGGPFPMPVLVAQGEADDLVREPTQRGYAATLCASGQSVEYRPFAGRDHLSLVAENSPLTATLVDWTRERLAGTAAVSACP